MKMDITQAPFNTSLMGVIRGVADHLEIDLSTPALYGRSGHAFFMNIHEAICPSGPYCWNIDPFIALLENCGIHMKKHGFFSGESAVEERNILEKSIKAELEMGNPCCVVNMDYQLVTGFDDTGFICSQPWDMDFPPAHLSFGNWAEWKDEIHACFFSFESIELPDPDCAIRQSLQFVRDLNENPSGYTVKPYACGMAAYDAWLRGVRKGYGTEHGNWWNGTVWSECRKQGALYFGEIAGAYPTSSLIALKLQSLFDVIGDILLTVSDKKLEKKKKIELLKEAKELEKEVLLILVNLADFIES
ncbi:MAG: hypothetical protein KAR40_08390 [Candidatus Sabulitectum sp.]|nr:hypothetical protein [Candidatus Sabulitectum sp.]